MASPKSVPLIQPVFLIIRKQESRNGYFTDIINQNKKGLNQEIKERHYFHKVKIVVCIYTFLELPFLFFLLLVNISVCTFSVCMFVCPPARFVVPPLHYCHVCHSTYLSWPNSFFNGNEIHIVFVYTKRTNNALLLNFIPNLTQVYFE